MNASWQVLKKKSRPSSRNTVGIDGVSINDFARDEKGNLNKLCLSFRKGKFGYEKLRPHLIPKANGKDRLICVPTVIDRIVQRALLEELSTKYYERLANRISFGFIKNRGVGEAVSVACVQRKKNPWVFKTDITSFFDSVDRKILAGAITKNIRETSLHKLLIEASACEIQHTSSRDKTRIKKLGIKEGLGIRQGMPLSPFFANLLLLKFDETVQKKKYACVRYADDLIFFAKNENECKEIAAFCSEELGNLGLAIPRIELDSKSTIHDPETPAEFLGLGLCLDKSKYVLRLMPKQLERIRETFSQMTSIKELLSRRITLATLGRAIESRKNGYLHAYGDCINFREFENCMKDIQQKILKKIYVGELKMDLRKLPVEAKTFLSL
ncbi:Reverse transcriptase (RNA-dependent DNA polymerase) [Nitrosovibrio sp. Nv4]|nr:Reverse transcriptase (RNA-dependent DNA polymerase) [Nitrosovibrio sp. Nv4]